MSPVPKAVCGAVEELAAPAAILWELWAEEVCGLSCTSYGKGHRCAMILVRDEFNAQATREMTYTVAFRSRHNGFAAKAELNMR